MTDWINTLFSLRAAVDGELRSQELSSNNLTSSCTVMLSAERKPELGGCLVMKNLHLHLQILDCSIKLILKSRPDVYGLIVHGPTTDHLRDLGIKN